MTEDVLLRLQREDRRGQGFSGEDGVDDSGWCEGRGFADERRWWLEEMVRHDAGNRGIQTEDIGFATFDQSGGLGRVHSLYGEELPKVIEGLNRELVA